MYVTSQNGLERVVDSASYGHPQANLPIVGVAQAYFETYSPDSSFERDRVLEKPCDQANLGTLVIALMPSGFLNRKTQRYERVLPFQINTEQIEDWIQRYQDQELLHDFTQEEDYTQALHKLAQTIHNYQEQLTNLKRIPDKQLIKVLNQIMGEKSTVYLPDSVKEILNGNGITEEVTEAEPAFA